MTRQSLADAAIASRKTVTRRPRFIRRKIRQDVLRNTRAFPRKRRAAAIIMTDSVERASLQDNPRDGAAMLVR